MVFLNVGANKGYNLVEFIQRYSNTSLTHNQWFHKLTQNGCVASCCGVCASCKSERITQQADAQLQLHAFELQPANVALLRAMTAGLPVTVHSTAVSNTTGVVYTTADVKPGIESVGIRARGSSGVERPVTTIDEWMRAHSVPRAHFMSIDTEGYDPLVLFGSTKALAEKRIDVLEFEYNRKWKDVLKEERPMGMVVEWMRQRGYYCFWQGNKGPLARVSAPCFVEETHKRLGFARSNAVCTHREDIIKVFRTCQRKPYCKKAP